MPEYDNNLSGALFKNKKKEAENQPDYTGEMEVEGVKYDMAGWMQTSKKGQPYMKVRLSIPQPKTVSPPPPPIQQTPPPIQQKASVVDDEIPF